jgi:hypothetical protein
MHDGPIGLGVAARVVHNDHAGDTEAAVDVETHQALGDLPLCLACGLWHGKVERGCWHDATNILAKLASCCGARPQAFTKL